MQPETHHSTTARQAATGPGFVPLAHETRVVVDTATAAHHLNRQPQTLRGWACKGDGPVNPTRVHGRLAWRTADLRALLGVGAPE